MTRGVQTGGEPRTEAGVRAMTVAALEDSAEYRLVTDTPSPEHTPSVLDQLRRLRRIELAALDVDAMWHDVGDDGLFIEWAPETAEALNDLRAALDREGVKA